MPFIPNTPESLIGRSDSLNPESTCRGITSSGRPCRRPLGASPNSSPATSRIKVPKSKKNLRVDDPADPDLYCWQHKDQASLSAKSSPGPRRDNTPILEQRESLDTLIDRLGIVEAQQKKKKKPANGGAASGGRIPQAAQGSVEKPPMPKPKTKKKEKTFCCCFTIATYEEELPARPKPRPVQPRPGAAAGGSSKPPSNQYLSPSSAQNSRPGAAGSGGGKSPRRSYAKSDASQTSQYLQLIPPSASPQTASQLMAELAKPISQQDEAGYIYIFWLTPESQPKAPPVDAARDLLAPPSRGPGGRQRRTSDVLQSYATQKDKSSKTILLKIGRASNVQRRLNEWTRQCGYNISLIRYYPYVSTNAPSTPRKMPHSHKVERLIHLELAGAGLRVSDKGACDSCGKSHREWFEVEASRKGIEMVDEIVKRWSDWDEGRN